MPEGEAVLETERLLLRRRMIADAGYCGLIANMHGKNGDPELAYELLRREWGRGLATEAASAVVGWAESLGYSRLWATVRDWNTALRRVVAKLGFVETSRTEPSAEYGDSLFYRKDLGPSRRDAV